jgi:hypothetical protein
MTLNPLRTALAVGALLTLWHLAWSALVAAGWARPLLDFVLWLHFLKVPIELEPFDLGRAALLVVVTGAIGMAIGGVFALVWNRLHPAAKGSA